MIPKGKLIIIGGHESKGEVDGENLTIHKKDRSQSHFEILGRLISQIPREHHVIEIIASASSRWQQMEELYINSFKGVGFTQIGYIKAENSEDACDPASIDRIQKCHAVFFTGGEQNKLISKLAETPLLTAIKNKYFADKDFIVAGTSAGAMVMSEVCITGGLIREAIYKGDIKLNKGFGLIKNVVIDTHFIKRGRFARLAHAVALNPCCLGIGLGEDTALIISEGKSAECVGSGMVILIDGSKIENTNTATVDEKTPIIVENLKVSILAEGCRYLLQERDAICLTEHSG